jgi:hypothetical protein
VRQPAGDQLPEKAGERHRDERHRDGDDEESDAVRTKLRPEPALGFGAREVGNDDHPKRLRPEHEHEVDAVRRHEAVRAQISAELVREEGACERRREAQGNK